MDEKQLADLQLSAWAVAKPLGCEVDLQLVHLPASTSQPGGLRLLIAISKRTQDGHLVRQEFDIRPDRLDIEAVVKKKIRAAAADLAKH